MNKNQLVFKQQVIYSQDEKIILEYILPKEITKQIEDLVKKNVKAVNEGDEFIYKVYNPHIEILIKRKNNEYNYKS
jgi:hypothetical protein